MTTFKIMDRTGHSTVQFTAEQKAESERLFNETLAKGYVAVAPGANGAPGRTVKAFDPAMETVTFYPHLVGG